MEHDPLFDNLIHAIFTLYSSRLEKIISQVKHRKESARDREKAITAQLLDYKERLTGVCEYYINDVWQNYQSYSEQYQISKTAKERKEGKSQKSSRYSKLMQTKCVTAQI